MNRLGFKHTFACCYIGMVLQSIVCGFLPLLFIIFNRDYNLPLTLITMIPTVNFITQLMTDSAAVFFMGKLGYRKAGLIGYSLMTIGFLCLGLVVPCFENIFPWLMVSVVLFSVGGGLMEVVLSPVVESSPSKNKEASMSLLHSMFGFGSAGVILITTILLRILGSDNWRYIAILWGVLSAINGAYFMFIPISKIPEQSKHTPIIGMLHEKRFWGFMLVMACGGAAEIGMSQWSSAFAESSLGVSKTIGDILGPFSFALMMALSRFFHSRFAGKIELKKYIMGCGIFACICYLAAALVPVKLVALLACGLCGFAVAIMWPGTLSLVAKAYPAGGASLFAIMALSGDAGCTLGPTTVGLVSSLFGGELKAGLLLGTIFPAVLVVGLMLLKDKRKNSYR